MQAPEEDLLYVYGASYLSNSDWRVLLFEDTEDERSFIIFLGPNSNFMGVPDFRPKSVWLENFVLLNRPPPLLGKKTLHYHSPLSQVCDDCQLPLHHLKS